MRSYLEKLQQEYENSLHRNSAIPKGKNQEAEEALNQLSAARINYRSAAVEMVYSITILQQRKRFEILDNVCKFDMIEYPLSSIFTCCHFCT